MGGVGGFGAMEGMLGMGGGGMGAFGGSGMGGFGGGSGGMGAFGGSGMGAFGGGGPGMGMGGMGIGGGGGGGPAPAPVPAAPPEDPLYAELRSANPGVFDALNADQQATIVHIIKNHHCTFEVAIEHAMDADWDRDLTDAMFESMDPDDDGAGAQPAG
jgi:hypothetical protein